MNDLNEIRTKLIEKVKASMPILEEAALAELEYDWHDHHDPRDAELGRAANRVRMAHQRRRIILAEIAALQSELFDT